MARGRRGKKGKRGSMGWRSAVLLLALVVGLVVGAVLYVTRNDEVPNPVDDRQTRLQALVRAYIADQEGTHAVAINSLDGSKAVLVGAEREFAAASLFKVLVMYRVYERNAAGRLGLDSTITVTKADATEAEPEGGLPVGETVTVRRALEAMITVSSNNAAYALARVVGGWDVVRAAPRDLGLTRTRYDDGWWTTAADMERFFVALAEGRLVNAAASEEMVSLLARQKRNDRIPALLPAGVSVAHKTGELEDVRNDAGIVEGRGVRYVIVLMSQDADFSKAIKAQAQLSRLVYNFFSQPDTP
ncbi:MAG: serine hydrolase [Chloroflexota bacterium]